MSPLHQFTADGRNIGRRATDIRREDACNDQHFHAVTRFLFDNSACRSCPSTVLRTRSSTNGLWTLSYNFTTLVEFASTSLIALRVSTTKRLFFTTHSQS